MIFENIIGNYRILQILKNSIGSGSFSHAYLIHGEKGTGKKAIAMEFAKAILCENAERPCDTCVSCMKMQKGIHPDLMTVRKEDGKSIITISQIRSLREQAFIRPNESEYRVIIIEDSEEMNIAAANALLKVLEEPPAHIIFILTSNNISLLPETISSRCMCLETHEVPVSDVAAYLQSAFPDNPDIENAVFYSNGNIGRGIHYLSDEKCRERFKKARLLAKSLTLDSEYSILEALSDFDGDKEGLLLLLSDLDIIMSGVAFAKDKEFSDSISPEEAVKIHALIDKIRFKIMANANLTLVQSSFCAELKTIME